MPRLAAFFLPLAIIAVPLAAADSSPIQYRAELAAPSAPQRLIVRDTVWHCDGGACVAPSSNGRPAVICAALAREVGSVRSFSSEGRALSAEELERCNARAR